MVRRDYTKATDTMPTKTTTAQTATKTEAINTVIAVAYGADGQVLTYDETVEAIANRQGWFDRQGHWVNYARMMQEARMVAVVPTAKRYPN